MVQVWIHVCPGPLTGHQLVLESRDPPADVCLRDGLHKESSLCQAEAVHRALSVVLLCQQQRQIPGTLQIHMRTLNTKDQGRTYELHQSDTSYCSGYILNIHFLCLAS